MCAKPNDRQISDEQSIKIDFLLASQKSTYVAEQ